MASILSILFFTFIALVVSDSSETSLQCPEVNDGPCTCNLYYIDEFRINCPSNVGEYYVKISQKIDKIRIVIECMNLTSWEDFNLPIGRITKTLPLDLEFQGCIPPGKQYIKKFNETIDVSLVQILKLSGLRQQLLPEDLEGFFNTNMLVLSKNNLGPVHTDLLKGLPNLELLQLHQTNIKIPKYFFESSKNLIRLELAGTNLTTLPADYFNGLESLRSLDLHKCNIEELHPDVFSNMSSLVNLDLQTNDLKSLPSGIFRNLKNLEKVFLDLNKFSSLSPDLFQSCGKLTHFRMNNNINNIHLPSKLLSNKPNLKSVSIMSSSLLSLPEELFWNSTNLQEVFLDHNYLKKLPENMFRDAKKIKKLVLKINEIAELPDNIFSNCTNLEKLDLSHNKIKLINRAALEGLKNLKELNIENNRLTSIHIMAFESLKNLRIAKFKHNELTLQSNYSDYLGSISPFHPCSHLKILDLSYNNITELFGDWTYNTLELQKLDMSHNKIKEVKAADFQFMSSKITLDLRNNMISTIDLFNFDNVISSANSVDVKLAENPLICDCKILALLRYAKNLTPSKAHQKIQLDVEDMRCAGPSWYASLSIAEIDSKELKCVAIETNNPKEEDPCRFGSPCDCYKIPENKTLIVDCKQRNLTLAPAIINTMNMSHVILDLAGNKLQRIPDYGEGYESVVFLNLYNNNISHIRPEIVTKNLIELNLGKNQLISLDQPTLKALNKTDLKLTLNENPWKCDCDGETRDFLSFVYDKKHNLDLVTCGNGSSIRFWDLSVEDLCPNYIMYYIIIVIVSLFGLTLCLLAALYYRFQRHIKIWLFSKNLCMCLVSEEELDKDKIYDAFISYSHKDRDYVVEELMPNLEKDNFDVCIHERDWLAGEWIPTQIERSVEESRRTIIVLSANFLESCWSRLEFAAAHKQALKEQRIRVIIVLYGEIGPYENLDPDLRAYLEMNTYVKWGDPWFWRKLKYAMPHKNPREMMEHRTKMSSTKETICEEKSDEVVKVDIDQIEKGIIDRENLNNSMEETILEEKQIAKLKISFAGEKRRGRRFTETIYTIGKSIRKTLYKTDDKFNCTL